VLIAVVGGGLIPGCGGEDGRDGDAVATVGDAEISRSDFDSAVALAIGNGPDPRDPERCIADKRRRVPSDTVTTPSEADLEAQCRDELRGLTEFVMDSLIKAEWARQEGLARGIALTEAERTRFIADARRSGFLQRQALRRAGLTERRLLPRLLQNQLRAKVSKAITEEAGGVSRGEVASYYRQHRSQLVVDERRDVRVALARGRAQVDDAVAKLERGGGEKLSGLPEGERTTPLAQAIFRAAPGEVHGPVQEAGSWAVFVVDEVERPFRATFAQARDEIRQLLQTRRRGRAVAAFVERYRARTTCTEGFVVPSCANGPRPEDGAATF
jgi:PPIC-type PPIASE domain